LRVLEEYIFADQAISGATDSRAGLQRLLTIAKEKPAAFSVLLVDDTSRLSRKLSTRSASKSDSTSPGSA
jgi:DNA invertase Pin-like site-specific DNA recombinase